MSKTNLHDLVQDFRAGHKHLVRFIKKTPDSKKDRRGVIVAFKDEQSGTIRFGWSVCNPLDEFNKEVGFVKAINNSKEIEYHDQSMSRSLMDSVVESRLNFCEVPEWIREPAKVLMTRAYIYYKLVPGYNQDSEQ